MNEVVPSEHGWIDYELPKRLIAQEPLAHRADARLMVVDRQSQTIAHHHVRDLPRLLNHGDRLVLNDTKVIPAALRGQRVATGGAWHGLYLETLADGRWKVLCKTRGRLNAGEAIQLVDRQMRPVTKLWLLAQVEEGAWVVQPEADLTANDLLQQVGRVPLPPYIRGGQMVDSDVERYQTVFARRPGAVAAPTAGLHFTRTLLGQIAERGIELSAVTLHVGWGTFRAIQSPSLDEHSMHAEWGELSATAADELNVARAAGGRVIAVGTTVVRVLESAAQATGDVAATGLAAWSGTTSLFIRSPYTFRAVDALLTNFHFPRTTLLVLVQAFAGTELVRRAYSEAIREEYRFYSYGDAMLIV